MEKLSKRQPAKDYSYMYKDVRSLNKDEAKQVQQTLLDSGYDIGSSGIDGVIGRRTLSAINQYRKANADKQRVGPVMPTYSNTPPAKPQENNRPTTTGSYIKTLSSSKPNSPVDFSNINTSDKEQVKSLQYELLKNGYNIKVDGLYGPNTEKALNEYRSKMSAKDNTGKQSPFKLNPKGKCDTDACTAYVGDQLEDLIGIKERERISFYGDAWTVRDNIIARGATPIYNVFPSRKPKVDDPDAYVRNLTAQKPNITKDQIKPGDVVNMYYGGSSYARQAYDQGGSVFSTHAGIVKEDDNGNLYVEHNVHGKIYKDKIEDMLDNKVRNSAGKPVRITAITRPNYNPNVAQKIGASIYSGARNIYRYLNTK